MWVLSNKRRLTAPSQRTACVGFAKRFRSLTFAVALFPLALLFVGCGMSSADHATPPVQSTGGSTGQHLRLVGSTALLPLAARAGDLFHQQHPDIQVNVAGGGSVTGLQAVTNHQADIGDSDIYADPVTYPDPNLTDHIICVVAFTLIVDPQINIPSLTSQQILAIFTGKVTNWKAIGGPDQAIITVIRPTTSGTRALFRKYILGGAEESGKPLTSDSSTGVLDQVAHTPGAIGYVTTSLLNSTVRAIGIDGVSATQQNIKNGKYKFWGYEHMYTLANGVSPITSFLDFMQTAEIQHLAQQLGYISVNVLGAQASIPSSVKEQNTR